MLISARRNMRMSTRLNIWIHTNRNKRQLAAMPDAARGFFEQNFKFRFGFDVEEQNPAPVGVAFALAAPCDAILERLANLFAGLADTRKNDLLASNSDSSQHLQLTARDDVESIPRLRYVFQNREVSIRLHGK